MEGAEEEGGASVLIQSKKRKRSLDHHLHHHPVHKIPSEILRLIFQNLIPDIKILLKLKCVCREWNATIEDLDFVKSYRIEEGKNIIPYGRIKRMMKANSGRLRLSKEAVTFVQSYVTNFVKMLIREATKKANSEKENLMSQAHVKYAIYHRNMDQSIPQKILIQDKDKELTSLPPPSSSNEECSQLF